MRLFFHRGMGKIMTGTIYNNKEVDKLTVRVKTRSDGKRYLLVGMYGLLISFIGALPLGTLNITAFNIAASQNVNEALLFAFAAVIVELVIVRLTLTGNPKINFKGKVSFYILPFAVVLLVYLAVSSFMSIGGHQQLNANTAIFPMIRSSILLGLVLSVLNPLHIPFWMGWNRILTARNVLDKRIGSYTSYITGIGLGSLWALMIFIFLGKHIFQNYLQYGSIIAFVMGCLYLCLSFYFVFLIYKKYLKIKIT